MKLGLLLPIICFVGSVFGGQAKVARIVDGDTFKVESGDTVRMIGIDAPETKDIYGLESSRHLSELILGRNVELKEDTISKDRDVFGRLLRYVFVNGTDVNKQMILDGFAESYLKYRFDPAKENEYRQAQEIARKNQYGKWGTVAYQENLANQVYSAEVSENKAKTKGNSLVSKLPKIILIGFAVLILSGIGVYYYRKA